MEDHPWGEVPAWKAGEHLLNSAADVRAAGNAQGHWPTVALQQLLIKVRCVDGQRQCIASGFIIAAWVVFDGTRHC